MTKLLFTTIGSLASQSAAQSALNANFTAIQTAFENTLSRDGTATNDMDADLDMNSNRILNLPAAVGNTEPVRFVDVQSFVDAAEAAQVASEAALDSFTDLYLGVKSVDPTLDNDGNALLTGALYFNNVTNEMMVYSGVIWEQVTLSAATIAALDAAVASALASEVAAGISETNASNSESNASSSASGASSSASTAITNAANAVVSASNASTSASNAATSESNAAASLVAVDAIETNVTAIYDSFDDVYLGAKPTPPTVDNDGDALTEGDLYYNNGTGLLYYFNGSIWTGLTNVGLLDVVDDLSPQLGGNLDLNSKNITGTGNLNYTGALTLTGDVALATTKGISWAAGDAVFRHSAGILTVAPGDLRVTTAGTNTASVATVGGTQTLTGKTVSSASNTLTLNLAAGTLTGTKAEFNTAVSDTDLLFTNDLGSTVQSYDATILVDADIGVNVQAYDSDLTTWAGLTSSTNAQSLVTAANYAAMRTLLDLEVGVDFYSTTAVDTAISNLSSVYQPLDSDLTAIAALTTTSYGIGALEKTTAGTAATYVGLGTADAVGFAGITNSGATALSGVISPTQITAQADDYAPTGLSTATTLRLDSDATRAITGLTGGASGRLILIHYIGTTSVTLKDENAGSTAANRFALLADVDLVTDACILLQYDATSSRWRIAGGSGSGGGSPTTAEYLVGALDGTLSAERLVTDTPFATWDIATAGIARVLTGDGTGLPSNIGLVASVASSALTIAIKGVDGNDPSATNPVFVPFRSPTAATGVPVVRRVIAANSLVISSGSTMGFTSATAGRIWIVLFDDAGTLRLGAINCLTTAAGAGSGRDVTAIYPLRDDLLVSSTAEGGAGAADSAQVFYTGTAVTTKALRILGYMEWSAGLTTAGTWDIVPTNIQLFGPGVSLPGNVVAESYSATGTNASTTTTVPNDDTIMQNGEGGQFMTISHTPISAANILHIDAKANIAGSGSLHLVHGLFRDSTANALATSNMTCAAGFNIMGLIHHATLAAAAATTTFKFRAGPGSGTLYFNTIDALAAQGGTLNSYMSVREIMG